MSRIITDEKVLRTPCEPVKYRSEGGVIARKLFDALARHNKRARKPLSVVEDKLGRNRQLGAGLAAPQIGTHKSVCIFSVNGLVTVLMNPVIVEHSTVRIPFKEGCLSFPGKQVETWRYIWVKVDTLNHGLITRGPTDPSAMNSHELFRSVVAQHEIDHLLGVLMFDRTKEE